MNNLPHEPRPPDSDTPAADNPVIAGASIHGTPLPKNWNYETTVSQVEGIINRIETGELELADVFTQFAVAVEHLHHCELFLSRQKQQMDLLIDTLLDDPDPF